MQDGIEQYSVTFHDRARHVFFQLYQEFQQCIRPLDRQKDENVYQQLQIRYAIQLRNRLQDIGHEMLVHIHHANRNKATQLLNNATEEYVHEFMQKARSL